MAIGEYLEEAKKYVSELKRKYKFKKANKQRDRAANLLAESAECRGKLGICQNEFNRIIKTESSAVRRGRAEGLDVFIQQNMVWDAALGYLLVRDAMFSLESISSNDSIAHAYDLLEVATMQMKGKRPRGGVIPGLVTKKSDRSKYGYLTTEASVANREKYLETFFENLLATGDIEACINASKPVALHEGDVISSYSSNGGAPTQSSVEDDMRAINEMTGKTGAEEYDYSSAFDDVSSADVPDRK